MTAISYYQKEIIVLLLSKLASLYTEYALQNKILLKTKFERKSLSQFLKFQQNQKGTALFRL